MSSAALLRARIESSLGESFSSTLLLRERPALLTVPIGVAALDTLTGGLPRGALTEIVGPPSSGRTSVMLTALAGATRRQKPVHWWMLATASIPRPRPWQESIWSGCCGCAVASNRLQHLLKDAANKRRWVAWSRY